MTPLEKMRLAFPDAKSSGAWFKAHCTNPEHPDRNASFTFRETEPRGKVTAECRACGNLTAALRAVGLSESDLYPENKKRAQKGEGRTKPRRNTATAQQPESEIPTPTGCTLLAYAEAKRLPVAFLKGLGVSQMWYSGAPALRIAYCSEDGTESAVRFRTALAKEPDNDNRFKWKSGSKPSIYGLSRLESARRAGWAFLVEGESDCHTAWYHGLPAFGLPGSCTWREEWAVLFAKVERLYFVVEPDTGGEAVVRAFNRSILRDRISVVRLPAKDVSELYLSDPDNFQAKFQEAIEAAVPLVALEAQTTETAALTAWETCKSLAKEPNILAALLDVMRRRGMTGEDRAVQILYLALVSRRLSRPVSVVVKGASSSGKSFLVESVLSLFPASAYYALSAMSDRALAYSEEPLTNRFLVIYEAAGVASDMATYLMRSLLSEGCVRYETVERTPEGIRPRFIERPGPTGLILTTTAANLHPENETRLLSIVTNDTQDQTRAILQAIADENRAPDNVDAEQWQALSTWLEGATQTVTIPYARELADKIPPVAVRLRRDFTAVLNLIRAHALLHQATREKTRDGRIIATLADYAAVRGLVLDIVSEGLQATVPDTTREVVQAVQAEHEKKGAAVMVQEVARRLMLDKSAASRRVHVALTGGWLINQETKRGRPALLTVGEPLPHNQPVLPTVEQLQGCRVAEREDHPLPPDSMLDEVAEDGYDEEDLRTGDDAFSSHDPFSDDESERRLFDIPQRTQKPLNHWES